MNQTKTIYGRLIISLVFIAVLISGLYGTLVYNAMKYTEDDILNRRVQMESQYFLERYAEDKDAKLPNSAALQSYTSSSPDIPPWLIDQPLGSRELHEREVHVSIAQLPGGDGSLYVVLDEHASSSLEDNAYYLLWALLTVGACIAFLALSTAVFLGKTITKPLLTLTAEIEEFDVSKPSESNLPFHGFNREDEVGELSRSFTLLVERINGLLKREQQFTRYASHELRTPLAIVRNSLAVLQLPEGEPERQKRNITRIENAAINMESLISTFLYMGLERGALRLEPVSTDAILKESLEKHSNINEDHHIQLIEDIESHVVIENDAKLVQVLFDNIIRNVFMHGKSKATIKLSQNGLHVENDLEKSSLGKEAESTSYGMEIIERISEHCKLDVKFEFFEERFAVTISF